MPQKLMTTTEAVDPVFIFIFGISIVLLLAITAVMVGFVIRYHRSRAPEPTSAAAGNLWLEIVWTILPTVLVMVMFYYGWAGYLALRNVPPGALPVTATASMWSWSFSYANGKTSPRLYVPVGKPVVVNLVSRDVLHGFYIPAFRIKRDVVPGMKNHVWFMAPKAANYDLFCSVYCGTGHSAMITTVVALPPEKFAEWLQQSGDNENPALGLMEKLGCLGCHSLDGSPRIGPTFKGLYGRQFRVTQNGTLLTITADETYLRESIRAPSAKIVEGYQPIMPTYPGLTDAEVESMVEYIENLQ